MFNAEDTRPNTVKLKAYITIVFFPKYSKILPELILREIHQKANVPIIEKTRYNGIVIKVTSIVLVIDGTGKSRNKNKDTIKKIRYYEYPNESFYCLMVYFQKDSYW